MTPSFDLIIHGGICLLPTGPARTDLGIRDGRIATIGSLARADGRRFDAAGLHVLPGVIDTQCHFREPGLTHKEDIGSGSASAALGGVTTFFEMPNTQPSTDSPEALAWKVARAKETSWTDFAFYLGATAANAQHLGEWENLEGCAGVKCFLGSSTGTLLVDQAEVLKTVLRSGKRRIAFHSEEEARLKERKPLAEAGNVQTHPVWRDAACAENSTRQLIAFAKDIGRKIHVLHVSTAEEIPLLAAARDVATCELTPQHLTLVAPDCYARLGTLAQMNPPLRDARHHDELWKALQGGLVDVLGSDHAPHTLEEKNKPYPQSPSGMPGVQTLLPVMLRHVAAGKLSLERLVQLTGSGPARVFGIKNKGAITTGFDADLAVVDLKARERMKATSRCGWTPFDGEITTGGYPVATFVRGHAVMRDGELLGKPSGQTVQFITPPSSRV